jgi:hypothetical protein
MTSKNPSGADLINRLDEKNQQLICPHIEDSILEAARLVRRRQSDRAPFRSGWGSTIHRFNPESAAHR